MRLMKDRMDAAEAQLNTTEDRLKKTEAENETLRDKLPSLEDQLSEQRSLQVEVRGVQDEITYLERRERTWHAR